MIITLFNPRPIEPIPPSPFSLGTAWRQPSPAADVNAQPDVLSLLSVQVLTVQADQEIAKDFFIQLQIPFYSLNGSGLKLNLGEDVSAFLMLPNGISQHTPAPNVNRRHFAAGSRYILAYLVDGLGDVWLLHMGVEDESKLVVPHAKNLLSTGLPPTQAGSRKNEGP
jgi:hypothetical protein